MDRLVITGGSGLLALNWACRMRRQFDVILGTHRHPVSLEGVRSVALDLESPNQLSRQLQVLEPKLVIHTAGMTSVEQCEQQPRDAEHANAGLTKNVAIATHGLGIKLVHISTDHLFTGNRPQSSEKDKPQPLNVYARTKLRAEGLVGEIDPQALIIRTNFFGWGHVYRQSFSDWIIQSLRAGREITMFDDVFFTPILVDDLALTAHEIIAKGASGVYNVVGEERISKYDFAYKVATCFGLSHALIARGQIGKSRLSVLRPRDMSLGNMKVRGLLRRQLGSVDDFLKELSRQEQRGRVAELRNAVRE